MKHQSNLGGGEYLASRIFVSGHEYIPSPSPRRDYKGTPFVPLLTTVSRGKVVILRGLLSVFPPADIKSYTQSYTKSVTFGSILEAK